MTVRISDIKRVGGRVHRESGTHGQAEAAPFLDEFAGIGIPHLNTRVVGVTIEDNQTAFGIHLHSMYRIELTRFCAFDAADDLDEFSILREMDDTVIFVAIRHEDIAVWSNVRVAGAIK